MAEAFFNLFCHKVLTISKSVLPLIRTLTPTLTTMATATNTQTIAQFLLGQSVIVEAWKGAAKKEGRVKAVYSTYFPDCVTNRKTISHVNYVVEMRDFSQDFDGSGNFLTSVY